MNKSSTTWKKKGQSALFILFGLFVFGVVWITGLAPWIAEMGQTMVTTNGLTGGDAFFFANLNLFIGIFYIIALIAVGRYGFT